ncbi:MAG: PP2C family protein-serine/threonine phosphatase [Anaerolineae bacterium]
MDFLRRLFKPKEETKDEEEKTDEETFGGPNDGPVTTPLPGSPPQTDNPQTRPLEAPKEFKSKNQLIRFGMASDTGRVRSNNQDAAMTLLTGFETSANMPTLGLFIVADGMGGHTDGEIASAVAVQTIANRVLTEVIRPHLMGQPPSADQRSIPEVLSDAMNAANESVQIEVPNGGTTATVVGVRGDLAFISHVGDSRAYLVTDGINIELITRDHSLVLRLQELNQITEEEAEFHPQKNVLYRAIGQNTSLEADAATRRLPPASSLVICSDGLWGQITENDILTALKESSSPQEACDRLVELANANGGPDNITVVVIEMPE